MRVTVSHTKPKEDVMRSVDHSFDNLFRHIGVVPIHFVEEKRTWDGSTLHFAIAAKMGFVSTPIKGTIEVTDRDVIIDADLGILERLIPVNTVKKSLTGAVRGLLK